MSVNFFQDGSIDAFSPQAKDRLKFHNESFISDLIDECERLETARRAPTAKAEITGSLVDDAARKLRGNLFQPSRSFWSKARSVLSPLLALISGLVFDHQSLSNPTYIIIFFLLLAVTIIVTTVHAIWD